MKNSFNLIKKLAIGQNIRQIRQDRHLTQDELAKIIGVSRSRVIDIEKGKRDLKTQELGQLADFLGVGIDDLLSQSPPNEAKYRDMIMLALQYYQQINQQDAPKTFLAKLVYLADFAWYYDHLKPMSGFKYRRLPYGPVTDVYFRVIDELRDEGRIGLKIKPTSSGNEAQLIAAKGDFRPQHLSLKEKQLIKNVVTKWQGRSTQEIVDFTHQQLPWQICRPDEYIPYSLITQEEPKQIY